VALSFCLDREPLDNDAGYGHCISRIEQTFVCSQ
jgi:hypothetical protein